MTENRTDWQTDWSNSSRKFSDRQIGTPDDRWILIWVRLNSLNEAVKWILFLQISLKNIFSQDTWKWELGPGTSHRRMISGQASTDLNFSTDFSLCHDSLHQTLSVETKPLSNSNQQLRTSKQSIQNPGSEISRKQKLFAWESTINLVKFP